MLYIGSLERRRNPMLMVEMAAAMKADTALILVGAGPMTETVRQRIKALGLNNVLMTGALGQEALPAIYRNSDVFLLPSDYEIYGMVLLEALYFGVPCVTTATAGGIDVIGNNHAGAVIDGVGLDDWVAAVRKTTLAAANPEYSERLQALVRETFSWQKIAQRYMDYVSENRV